MTNSISVETLEQENLQLLSTVHLLDAQLQESRSINARANRLTKSAYSAMLEKSMDARLEDGTPVISVVFAHNPEMRQRYENVFLG